METCDKCGGLTLFPEYNARLDMMLCFVCNNEETTS